MLTLEVLKKLFVYDKFNNQLIHRQKDNKTFNSQYAGAVAGGKNGRIRINGKMHQTENVLKLFKDETDEQPKKIGRNKKNNAKNKSILNVKQLVKDNYDIGDDLFLAKAVKREIAYLDVTEKEFIHHAIRQYIRSVNI